MRAGELWRHADFNKLWFGQSLSNFGDKISRIALPTIAIITLHGTAFDVGLLAALAVVPYLVLGPVAGVLADRVARRTVLIVADAGRLLALVTIPLAYALDSLTMWHLFAVAAVNGVLTVFFEVSYQSYLPALVGRDNIVEANGKLQTTRSLADVGGAATGGVLMQVFGTVVGVLVDALTFLVSVVSLVFVRHREERPQRGAPSASSVWNDIRAGMGHIGRDRRLRTLMSATGAANFAGAAASAVILVLAYGPLDLTPAEAGAALGAAGIGLFVGATTAGRIAKALSVSGAMMAAVTATALAYLAIGLAQAPFALVVLAGSQFLLGAANSVYNIHVLSTVAKITPGEIMGRVSGTAMTVVHGSGAAGALVGGVVGGLLDARTVVLGAAVLVLGALLLIAASPVRSMDQRSAATPGPAAPPAEPARPDQTGPTGAEPVAGQSTPPAHLVSADDGAR